MSMMNKLKSMLRGHEDKAAKGIDMAGDMFDRRTRGKYRHHVDKAQRKLKDELARPEGGEGRQDRRPPGARPGSPPDPPNPYGDQGRPPQT